MRWSPGWRPSTPLERSADLAAAVLDLIVPQHCAGCGEPGRPWCGACAARSIGVGLWVPGPLRVRSAHLHEGAVARAITAFKDDGQRALAAPLSTMLAAAVRDLAVESEGGREARIWIIPVPTRPMARRRRGADHMGVLAARAARLLRRGGMPAFRVRALRHVRAGRDQVGLSRQQRHANVIGSLRAGPVPPGLLVVVDDVTTTGATLGEAVRAIRAATGRSAMAATISWAAPRQPARSGIRATPHLASARYRD